MIKEMLSAFVAGVCIITMLLSCHKGADHDKKIVSYINDYQLTLDEFERLLASEVEMDREFKVTREGKKKFLEELIRKELLIQEAKELKLDQKEEFVRAIERYWESTLIRGLLDMKANELEEKIYVDQEEIEKHYNEIILKKQAPQQLDKIEEQIRKELEEKKKRKQMKAWIDGLKNKAKLKINYELL